MANEVTFSDLATNGGRVAEVLSADIHEILMDPTDLRALMQFHPFESLGSDTITVSTLDRDHAMAAATNETTGGQSNLDLVTGNFTLQVARYVAQFQPSDLFGITGGPIDVDAVVSVLNGSLGLTFTDLLTAAFSNLATTVGTTTVNLSIDNLYTAMFSLNLQRVPNSAERPISCVLHPQQYNDMQDSLRSESGVAQWQAATADQVMAKGPGFKGRWNGVDYYDSDSCPTANAAADRVGAMFGYGAFGYTLASTAKAKSLIPAGALLVDLDEYFVEINRDATNGMSELIANGYPAVVEQEDLRAVRIVTDA